ncbi:peptide/nickel transport system ATP-binding protein [Natronoarchaeum philippinense]|uniref:Peptide/nickel transport system ATP-binding protein n=1 Tax=Natronoarchaeum philippinense TaxID=558529 RepID=A0A285P6I2_NATPI|nr:ABC transporter ATP-binding protein [Natronoarchaeum philippinense]SNZ17058.1 peptide/nickel transport system ATP-binding protein [Natronoarchaeum philippinense]
MFEATEATTAEPTSNEDPIIEIRNAHVTFDMSRGQARVLNDIDMDIYRGETLGVAGESGCGKSMFASALLDAVRDPGQLHGEITYYPDEGEPVDILDLAKGDMDRIRWQEIAMVFQGAMSSFNPTTTIRAHFEETLAAHNEDKDEGMERARQLMRDLNLEPDRILDSHQHELSGGQRQRALIALSLVLEPEVLVLDEPTASLDLLMQRTILRLLHEVKEKYDLTLVLISHDLPVISGFADRLGVMYGFEFVEFGETTDVMYNAAHPYTRSLLRATPNLDMPIEDIVTVEGTSPDPVNIPSGCPYHPRCPVADDRCEIEKPDMSDLDEPGHEAACFYTDQAKTSIPVTFGGEDQ